MSSQAGPSTVPPSTAALHPSANNKRISTIKSNPNPNPNTSPGKKTASGSTSVVPGKDVISPTELCGFVDNLLSQLESRFDEMSGQILGRMDEMSSRIDNLETSIHDLIHGDIDQPPVSSINTGSAPTVRGS